MKKIINYDTEYEKNNQLRFVNFLWFMISNPIVEQA